METNSNNSGLLPSVIALKDSLNPQARTTSSDPTMLTPSQQELLRRAQQEIAEYLAQAPPLAALLARLQMAADNAA